VVLKIVRSANPPWRTDLLCCSRHCERPKTLVSQGARQSHSSGSVAHPEALRRVGSFHFPPVAPSLLREPGGPQLTARTLSFPPAPSFPSPLCHSRERGNPSSLYCAWCTSSCATWMSFPRRPESSLRFRGGRLKLVWGGGLTDKNAYIVPHARHYHLTRVRNSV